jgi:hypothetical protein
MAKPNARRTILHPLLKKQPEVHDLLIWGLGRLVNWLGGLRDL